MPISLDKALKLQENSNQLRNICILAHVDHGKTSISDYLIATNGIISPKTCGSVRYLDSRPDEQERGITMEASAIALYFSLLQSDNTLQEYLINLIDCPGHVDFASEVNAASQLCDGALLVVDVVEGVCSQTHTALHQIWHERLQPILVLNKFDRLVDELKLTPLEAYLHLEKLIQNVNVITGEFYQKAMAEGDDHPEVLFSPLKGNVVFTSAIHGWGCQVDYFAHVFAAKLKLNVEQLLPWIWGEHYFDPKTKKILSPKQALGRHLKPLAVHLVFDNLWSIYQACGLGVLADPPHVLQLSKLESIVQKLSLKVNSRDYRKSSEHMVATVLAQWLPLSNALLIPIVKQVLPPHLAQRERLPKLFPHLSEFPTTLNSILQGETLQTSFLGYFAKMVALPLSLFPSLFDASTPHSPTSTKKEKKNFDIPTTNNAQNMENEIETELAVNKNEQEDLTPPFSSSSHSEDEFLVGIARCFCGQVRQGDTVYLLGPKFQADQPHGSSTLSVHVEALFLWLGQDIIPVPYVTAGQVFGIYSKDLQSCFFKCGTLSSTLHCPLLTQFTNQVSMVKVAVEPTRIQDLEKLVHGLRLLSQSDPAVEIMITASGEHVLATAGEVHLERCLYDLRERFCKCEFSVSEPIVPFRETVFFDSTSASQKIPENNESLPGHNIVRIANQSLLIRCMPLPSLVTDFLIKEQETSKTQDLLVDSSWCNKLQEVVNKCSEPYLSDTWASFVCQRGPSTAPANLLWALSTLPPDCLTAFQLVVVQGPLCHEPMHGVVWMVEWTETEAETEDPEIKSLSSSLSSMMPSTSSGTWVSTFKQALMNACTSLSMYLVLAMYQLEIRCQYHVLGAVYHLLQKRYGKVIKEQAMEGSPYFLIQVEIPILHSFHLVKELGIVTSGAAFAQLTGTCWSILLEDPLEHNSSLELYEENRARKYYLMLRKRKGLPVDTKLVEHGEKQRTLMRK